MMTRLREPPPPEVVEVTPGLKVLRIDQGGAWLVKAWRGNGTRPYAYYRFRTADQREAWINREAEARASAEKAKTAYMAARKAATMRTRQEMKPGTILHYSWGYDQTNCEFFEVVEVRGATCIIREIASEDVGPQGHMSTRCRPIPGRFVGEPQRKLIQSYGVSMDHGVASIVDPSESHYSSWYA